VVLSSLLYRKNCNLIRFYFENCIILSSKLLLFSFSYDSPFIFLSLTFPCLGPSPSLFSLPPGGCRAHHRCKSANPTRRRPEHVTVAICTACRFYYFKPSFLSLYSFSPLHLPFASPPPPHPLRSPAAIAPRTSTPSQPPGARGGAVSMASPTVASPSRALTDTTAPSPASPPRRLASAPPGGVDAYAVSSPVSARSGDGDVSVGGACFGIGACRNLTALPPPF
jgi:hypothetical protein